MTPSLDAEQYWLLVSLETMVDQVMSPREVDVADELRHRGLCTFERCDCEDCEPDQDLVEWFPTDDGRLAMLCYRVVYLGAEVPR